MISLMIPTMDGASLSLRLTKMGILSFYKWSMESSIQWIKKLLCKFFGHDMDHEKFEWVADYDLHVYSCKRCGEKHCIEWNKNKKIFVNYNEKCNETSKNS